MGRSGYIYIYLHICVQFVYKLFGFVLLCSVLLSKLATIVCKTYYVAVTVPKICRCSLFLSCAGVRVPVSRLMKVKGPPVFGCRRPKSVIFAFGDQKDLF